MQVLAVMTQTHVCDRTDLGDMWLAEVWRLEQARELVTLCQVSLPSGDALQPDLAALLQRMRLYADALSLPEVADEFK